jgi:hypothetical protein
MAAAEIANQPCGKVTSLSSTEVKPTAAIQCRFGSMLAIWPAEPPRSLATKQKKAGP